jgi:hypothetical protein
MFKISHICFIGPLAAYSMSSNWQKRNAAFSFSFALDFNVFPQAQQNGPRAVPSKVGHCRSEEDLAVTTRGKNSACHSLPNLMSSLLPDSQGRDSPNS